MKYNRRNIVIFKMKEEEFIEKVNELNNKVDGVILSIPIYYSIDREGNIILDVEGVEEELDQKILNLQEILENDNKLKEDKNEYL